MLRYILRFTLLIVVINFSYSLILDKFRSESFLLAVLMILVIPIVLYFAFRDLMIHRWNYRLPIGGVLIAGFSITLLSGVLLATLHWLDQNFFHLFTPRAPLSWPLQLWAYVKWYSLFALGSIPVAYVILLLKLRRKK